MFILSSKNIMITESLAKFAFNAFRQREEILIEWALILWVMSVRSICLFELCCNCCNCLCLVFFGCLSIFLVVSLVLFLCFFLCVCLFVSFFLCLFLYACMLVFFACLLACLFVCLFVCLLVCLFVCRLCNRFYRAKINN